MTRIVVLGSPGSGKSTLARAIGTCLGIPVVHLDLLYWNAGWQKSDLEAFRERTKDALKTRCWACEGNYAKQTFDLRIDQADLIVWIEMSRVICCYRIIKRALFDRRRVDLPTGCDEHLDIEFLRFIRYTWTFNSVARPTMEADPHLRQNSPKIVRLRTRDDIARFLASLRPERG